MFTQKIRETKLFLHCTLAVKWFLLFDPYTRSDPQCHRKKRDSGKGRACHHLSSVDASAIAETCLDAASVAQSTAQAGSIKMTSRWAELFTRGKKCSHRHSDWGHPIQEQMHPCDYSFFFLSVHHYLLKPQVCFVNPSFPLKSADHLTFETMWDEQKFSIWKLRMTQSLPVSSTFVAPLAELFQEISATKMLVSWTTQEGYH